MLTVILILAVPIAFVAGFLARQAVARWCGTCGSPMRCLKDHSPAAASKGMPRRVAAR